MDGKLSASSGGVEVGTRDPLASAQSLAELIRQSAEETERICTMPLPIVDAFRESGLFTIYVPSELGGGGVDAITMVSVIEEVSRADASTGWSLMANIVSTAVFSVFCGDDAVEVLFSGDQLPIMAGMLGPAGVARRAEGGFVVSGNYSFASGAAHATWIGGGASTQDDDQPYPFIYVVPREAVEFLGGWDVLGLCGTGSYDYRVPERFVAESFTLPRVNPPPRRGQPSWGLGFFATAVMGHAAVALGTAKRALEELVGVVDIGKQRPGVSPIKEQQLFLYEFATFEAKYRSSRAYLFEVLNDGISTIDSGHVPSDLQLHRVRQAATFTIMVGAEITEFAYRWSGSVGLRNPHPLGRLLRDMLAQTQHTLVDYNSLVATAPELMGAYRSS